MGLQIPLVQQAAVIENPGPGGRILLRGDVSVGEPGVHEILVKLEVSGVCGSEIRALLGWSSYTPIVGHEGVGIVVKAGADADVSLLGQRVGVKWLYSACTQCSACNRGFPNNCGRQLNTGRNVRGTLQQYVVADPRFVTRIPDGLASEVAAPLLCAGLTMMGAISKLDGQLGPGDWLVISGSGGGLGHIGVQIAAKVKGFRVIGIDSGEEKRKLSIESGASEFIDFAEGNVEHRVKEITGEGAHAIVVVSGSEDAFRASPLLVRNMGIIVCVGLPANDFNIPIPASLCSARALSITGVAVGSEGQMEEILEHALRGDIQPSIQVLDFHDIPQILDQLKLGGVTGRVVVRIPSGINS
ncbi:hypothetical protein JX266_008898 [Neoarthrinium moseri]|nr:hypothetical protein JX266_008898 [Neoarthrinium moseri]